MMLLKPVCVSCQRFYRPEKNGYPFVEGMPMGNHVPPGKEAADRWQPYKLWIGDLWQCEGCGSQIVVGVIAGPVAEHYQPGFAEAVATIRGGSRLQVNDC